MSIKIMSWVWENSPYEGKALLIHLALADFCNDAGECWPSQATLSRKARCSERHIRDIIRLMETEKYLEFTRVSTGYGSHRYKLIARNSVPPRNPTTVTPEVDDQDPGTARRRNHKEPLEPSTARCPYCRSAVFVDKPHNCSAMNQRMR